MQKPLHLLTNRSVSVSPDGLGPPLCNAPNRGSHPSVKLVLSRAGLPLFYELNLAQSRNFKDRRVAQLLVTVFENFQRAAPGRHKTRLFHICHLSGEHQTSKSICSCVCLSDLELCFSSSCSRPLPLDVDSDCLHDL